MATRAFSRLFRVSLALKLLDGVLELAGALLVLAVTPATMNAVVRFLTQHELAEDPRDFVANHLLTFVQHLTGAGRVFASVYLAVHGVIKVVLVVAVLRRRLWAYPAMLVVLLVFIAYQLYRLTHRLSVGMLALTIFDALVVWLVWREYRSLRVPGRGAG